MGVEFDDCSGWFDSEPFLAFRTFVVCAGGGVEEERVVAVWTVCFEAHLLDLNTHDLRRQVFQ